MRLPCGLEAVTSALLICALPTQLALAQTFKAGDTTVGTFAWPGALWKT